MASAGRPHASHRARGAAKGRGGAKARGAATTAAAGKPRGSARAAGSTRAPVRARARVGAKHELAPARDTSRLRGDAALAEYRGGAAMERFRKRMPQLWLQAQRLGRVLEIQQQIDGQAFPPGCCFLHANLVTVSHFCIRQVREVNLDTCQVTLDIHGDDNLEAGIVVIPLETVEWFGFPSRAVPTGVHFQGFGASAAAPAPPSEAPKPG